MITLRIVPVPPSFCPLRLCSLCLCHPSCPSRAQLALAQRQSLIYIQRFTSVARHGKTVPHSSLVEVVSNKFSCHNVLADQQLLTESDAIKARVAILTSWSKAL
eukprot:4350108-Amphidinium_carterae.1